MSVQPGARRPRRRSSGHRSLEQDDLTAAIRETLLRWSLFGVAFATLPIAYNALSALTRGNSTSYGELVQHGELLLVSAGISAAAAGELFGRDETSLRSTRLFLVGMCFIIVCLSSLWFADIASVPNVNQRVVAIGSTILFCCSVVCGGCCMILSQMRR
jgi:hypothetical protein